MIQLILMLFIGIVALGIYLHTAYELRTPKNKRYIDFEQFYFNVIIPVIFGTLSFLLITEQLKNPAVNIPIRENMLLFGLALFACIAFLGCGMHLVSKMLSRFIGPKHEAYSINKFYHIYAGHITSYTGVLLFMITLSILALKHPLPALENNLFYVLGGTVSGFFMLAVTIRPKEIIKIFWPILVLVEFAYIIFIQKYINYLPLSPLSLFITAMTGTMFIAISGRVVIAIFKRLAKKTTEQFYIHNPKL